VVGQKISVGKTSALPAIILAKAKPVPSTHVLKAAVTCLCARELGEFSVANLAGLIAARPALAP
jgi:hypothetical protein